MIPEVEKKSVHAIKAFQEGKLQIALKYLSEHSPFYKQLFKTNSIQIANIKTLEDLRLIPTTSKEDLQQFNDDFLCVPKTKIIDYVTTSGTLGNPVTFAMTDNDLDRLAYNESISFACAGIKQEDILQLMTTMDRTFMAGLAYFLGARKLGAGIIRVGAGIPELQWESILKFKPTYLIAVPSFILKLIDYAKLNLIDVSESGIKTVICIGEPIRNIDFTLNTLGQTISSHWDIKLISTYASTEMSTAFTECEAQQGGHHHPELVIVEILDDQNQAVLNGEIGELTITTLDVEAMPLLRYKTGDMVQAHNSNCICGRNTLRLGPVMGRKNHMIKYKGTTLYPPAIVNILNQFTSLDAFVIEISHDELGMDHLLIKLACANRPNNLLQDIQKQFQSKIRVIPTIEFHNLDIIKALQQSVTERKTSLVIDKRITRNK